MASFMITYLDTDDLGKSSTRNIMVSIDNYDNYEDMDKYKLLFDKVNSSYPVGSYVVPVNIIRL